MSLGVADPSPPVRFYSDAWPAISVPVNPHALAGAPHCLLSALHAAACRRHLTGNWPRPTDDDSSLHASEERGGDARIRVCIPLSHLVAIAEFLNEGTAGFLTRCTEEETISVWRSFDYANLPSRADRHDAGAAALSLVVVGGDGLLHSADMDRIFFPGPRSPCAERVATGVRPLLARNTWELAAAATSVHHHYSATQGENAAEVSFQRLPAGVAWDASSRRYDAFLPSASCPAPRKGSFGRPSPSPVRRGVPLGHFDSAEAAAYAVAAGAYDMAMAVGHGRGRKELMACWGLAPAAITPWRPPAWPLVGRRRRWREHCRGTTLVTLVGGGVWPPPPSHPSNAVPWWD